MKRLFVGGILILFLAGCLSVSDNLHSDNNIKVDIKESRVSVDITNFTECIGRGFPVMESFPRKCITPDGRTFVEFLEESVRPLETEVPVTTEPPETNTPPKPTSLPLVSPTAKTVTPTPLSNLSFYDSFNSTITTDNQSEKGWLLGTYTGGFGNVTYKLVNGGYRWVVDANQSFFIQLSAPVKLNLSDFYLKVNGKQLNGTITNEYGLFFRKVDNDNYYLFIVSDSQTFSLLLMEQGKWKTLIPPTWAPSIKRFEENELEVISEGPHFTFIINDVIVGDVYNSVLSSGEVGLAAGMDSELMFPGIYSTFEFDDFEVSSSILDISSKPRQWTLETLDYDIEEINKFVESIDKEMSYPFSLKKPSIRFSGPEKKSELRIESPKEMYLLIRGPDRIVQKIGPGKTIINITPGSYEIGIALGTTLVYDTFEFEEGKTYYWTDMIDN